MRALIFGATGQVTNFRGKGPPFPAIHGKLYAAQPPGAVRVRQPSVTICRYTGLFLAYPTFSRAAAGFGLKRCGLKGLVPKRRDQNMATTFITGLLPHSLTEQTYLKPQPLSFVLASHLPYLRCHKTEQTTPTEKYVAPLLSCPGPGPAAPESQAHLYGPDQSHSLTAKADLHHLRAPQLCHRAHAQHPRIHAHRRLRPRRRPPSLGGGAAPTTRRRADGRRVHGARVSRPRWGDGGSRCCGGRGAAGGDGGTCFRGECRRGERGGEGEGGACWLIFPESEE